MSKELEALAYRMENHLGWFERQQLNMSKDDWCSISNDFKEAAAAIRRLAACAANASAKKSISEMEPNETTISALCEAEANASAEARLREALVRARKRIAYLGLIAGKLHESTNDNYFLPKIDAALSPDPHASDCEKQGETTGEFTNPFDYRHGWR